MLQARWEKSEENFPRPTWTSWRAMHLRSWISQPERRLPRF